MTHTQTFPPPPPSYTNTVARDRFGHAAVIGLGDGFTVTNTPGGFVTLTATGEAGDISIAVYHAGIPTLIAALQQALTESQS